MACHGGWRRSGEKYAATVRSLLNNDREEEREHLTALPALDMEHFMYRQGFADVFTGLRNFRLMCR